MHGMVCTLVLSFLPLPKDVKFPLLFVCLLAQIWKIPRPIFTKFGVKVAHGSWKKPLDFGDNLNHVTLGLSWGYVESWCTPMGVSYLELV